MEDFLGELEREVTSFSLPVVVGVTLILLGGNRTRVMRR
jgi:hypothetical protein